MKSSFNLLVLLLFFGSGFHSTLFAGNEQLVTAMYINDNDTSFRYVYHYNQEQKRVETKYFQSGTNWIALSQIEWVYENDLCTKQIERKYQNYNWIDTYLIEYAYSNGQLTSEIHYKYISSVETPHFKTEYIYSPLLSQERKYSYSGSWNLTEDINYTYFPNENIQTISQNTYNENIVPSQYILTYTYNDRQLTDSILLQEREIPSGEIKNKTLTTFRYTTSNDLIQSQRSQKWETAGDFWVNTQKIDYEYDNNKLIYETYQKWTQSWTNDLRHNYYYDAGDVLVVKTTSKSIYQEWRNIISVIYSDFQIDKPSFMEAKYDFWGGNDGEQVSTDMPFLFNNEMIIKKGKSIRISYLPTDDTTTSDKKSITFNIYPNPSDGIFYFDTQQYNVLSWVILDLNGRILKHQMQTQLSGVVDLSDVNSGVYIFKAILADGELHQKLVKN